jgi:Cu/Ag efflux pump CusA
VVVGGLMISTVFTIFLIPAILSLTMETVAAVKRMFQNSEHA